MTVIKLIIIIAVLIFTIILLKDFHRSDNKNSENGGTPLLVNDLDASSAIIKESSNAENKISSIWKWPNSNGTWCNAAIYEIELKCQSYVYCHNNDPTGNPDSKDGKLVTIPCLENTFAASVNVGNMAPGKVVVATCLYWDQLDNFRKLQIKQDKNCLLIAQKLCNLGKRAPGKTAYLKKCSDI